MTPCKGARSGFTLIEVMVVMAVMALMAVMILPKNFFFTDPPLRALRKSVIELSDLALNGQSVRLRMEPIERMDRGSVVVEAFVREEDSFYPGKYTLEWKTIGLDNPIGGEGWNLAPEIVYFYSDGSCTPARITNVPEGERLEDGESAVLTVTGFMFEPDEIR